MPIRQVFYISDGTGITAENFGNSLLTQFPQIEFITKTFPFIKTEAKAKIVIAEIKQIFATNNTKPLVFSTIVNPEISKLIAQSEAIIYPLFENLIEPLELELQAKSIHKSGISHGRGVNYKQRLDAIDFALNTDDGLNINRYAEADIILLGVSRCGKTPTCLYLALNFQIKAANYPITDGEIDLLTLPKNLPMTKCFGLTINPLQLSQIRQERLANSNYAEINRCKYEISQVENMYFNNNVNYLNTSNISIEEISSEIISRTGLKR